MNFLKVSLLALSGLLCVVCAVGDASAPHTSVAIQWEQFKAEHNKVYATAEEENIRFGIFTDNLVRAAELNAANPLATFGVTRFSDLSPAEFKRMYLGYRPQKNAQMDHTVTVKHCTEEISPNADIDWRSKGAVTPVKDQGSCGSCWAFSATESVESAWFLAKGNLPVLAPQQIVSCDTKTGDLGCDGGWPEWSYKYIESAGGLTTEALYPYTSGQTGETGKCKSPVPAPVASISNFTFATPPCNDTCNHQDEATLLKTLSTGPVSICVNAETWSGYISGILTGSCSSAYDDIDHCVQLVGYSGSGKTPYWIVRNSWNTNWGEKGFINLVYGKNECGLADQATVPTI